MIDVAKYVYVKKEEQILFLDIDGLVDAVFNLVANLTNRPIALSSQAKFTKGIIEMVEETAEEAITLIEEITEQKMTIDGKQEFMDNYWTILGQRFETENIKLETIRKSLENDN